MFRALSSTHLSDAMLTEKNPTPVACQRGAMRAVTAFQLFDLYDFFQARQSGDYQQRLQK